MEKQHLTYFKIENFKRFDSFEMSNLGQFNLIVGDNNVGKTSVLEALTFDEEIDRLAHNYWTTFWDRGLTQSSESDFSYKEIQQTHFWEAIFKKEGPIIIEANGINLCLELRPHQQLYEHEKATIKEAVVTVIPEQWLKLSKKHIDGTYRNWQLIAAYFEGSVVPNYNTFSLDSYVPFISANMSYGPELIEMYYQFVNSNKIIRKEIENNLKLFIPKIEEIRPHKIGNSEVLGVILSDNNTLLPLTYFGDGTVKYVRLILEMLINQGRRLMLDEIGSGIHFTRLTSYWKSIIHLCSKYNVQLFATTHSLECQQAFIEALEDTEMQQYQEDARNISLIENKQGEVKAVTYDFGQFEYALNIGFNTRGGAR
ncbi:AAA family ATPase [Spirosoma sp. HMF3257]|uniref:ATPase n=1 Tax=Spirosoma telluris TaxID=2183553 RepID=A0A327NHI5_9BACT|nr:AAA family ATPase [Spirosoma telluris]RAI74801.1 ATPase [Spirosoma telluris]